MLRLLTGRNRALGPALLREVGDALKTEGDALYVVVPKQLTLETELFLLEGLSLQGSFRLRVLSPERLCGLIFDAAGRPAGARVDDRGRVMLVSRAMKSLEGELTLYRGALLQKSELNEWAYPRAVTLHNQYIAGVYDYIDLLKQSGRDEDEREIISVCRSALEREPFDDSIHIELMRTLLRSNNATEAKAQYEEVMHLHYHYLNVKPSHELMEFYNEIVEASKNVEFNLESICRQLYQNSREQSAFVCDFAVFKEIFNLQIRNIERLGTTMFLAVITVSGTDGGQMENIRQENVMRGLMEILRNNLREGDVITHFSPTTVAVLLPTVDYNTGDGVMDRIKQKFYQAYPNSNVLFNYRIAPLSANAIVEEPQKPRRGRGRAAKGTAKEKTAP